MQCEVYVRSAIGVSDTTFLGLTAEWWTAIGTVATAVIALLAAGFAAWQVAVMRRTREDETRPYVVVDVQPSQADHILVNLVVENIGRTVAQDVKLTFTPTLESTLKQLPPIAEAVLVKEGIPMMPPGRRIEALLDRQPDRGESNLPQRYDVTVNLKDAHGRRQHPQRYVLDIKQLKGLRHVNVYGVHHVVKALRDIGTGLNRVGQAVASTQVERGDGAHDEIERQLANLSQPVGDDDNQDTD